MNASILPRLRLFGAASILLLASTGAMAQTGPEAKPAEAAKEGTAPSAAKPAEKAKPAAKSESAAKADPDSKKTSTAKKPAAPSGFASEAEAKSHCHGTIVWVDSDHFNHYAGSREYGKKPGAFQCEKG